MPPANRLAIDPPPEPAGPRGRLLAACPRRNRAGPDQELRVVLDEYEGHPYISVRLWERDRQGGWWPLRGKGCSIRLTEAASVAEALRQALAVVNAPVLPPDPRDDDPDRPRFVERRRRPGPPR